MFLAVCSLIFTVFGAFNVIAVILPFFNRTVKWFRKSIKAAEPEKITETKKVK